MNSLKKLIQLSLTAAIALSLTSSALAQSDAKVSSFSAYLFGSKTGKLSGDVLADGAPPLANLFAGNDPSYATLVVVKIEGRKSTPENLRVHLIATAARNPLLPTKSPQPKKWIVLDKTTLIPFIDESGLSSVGFWLYDTGCNAVELKAFVVGSKPPPATASLPFICHP